MRHQTRWYVITGAPCSGKTSVLRELEHRGYSVVDETARSMINERLALGIPLEAVKADAEAFEADILAEKMRIASGLSPKTIVFFDRGIPDSIAYYQLAGLDPSAVMEKSRIFRYAGVFFFQRLRFEKDDVRTEDDRTAADLGNLILENYRLLGYEPIRIPVLTVKQRADAILETVFSAL